MFEKIVLATQNHDKVLEIQKLLADLDIEIVTLAQFSDVPEVVEDRDTLAGNAQKKAKVIAEFTGLPAVADDTGLEVDFLNGAPGVYSSRYSGENATYSENVDKLLAELKDVPWKKRTAKFRTIVALCANGHSEIAEGFCAGFITEAPRGERGFGYDPVFYVPEFDSTFAEMDLELKNKISHRGKAFLNFKRILEQKQK